MNDHEWSEADSVRKKKFKPVARFNRKDLDEIEAHLDYWKTHANEGFWLRLEKTLDDAQRDYLDERVAQVKRILLACAPRTEVAAFVDQAVLDAQAESESDKFRKKFLSA